MTDAKAEETPDAPLTAAELVDTARLQAILRARLVRLCLNPSTPDDFKVVLGLLPKDDR
jgi:hypothetical protein